MAEFFVNKQVLAKLSNYDKSFVEAYLFAKSLTRFTKHPILFNFKANSEAYRQLLGMGKHKYRRLLKSAIEHGLANYYGDNLHLISRQKERQIFSVKSRRQTEIKPSELYQFAQAQILIKNIKSQKKAIAHHNKGRCNGFANSTIDCLTQYPVLSRRKVGQLLNCSHTHAKHLLTSLKGFGLTVHKNTVQISMEHFKQLQLSNSYNARYNNGSPIYIGADRIEYKKVSSAFYNRYISYCNDL